MCVCFPPSLIHCGWVGGTWPSGQRDALACRRSKDESQRWQ
jgi:hypothetical protein